MTPHSDRWTRIEALFEALADLPPEARVARLAEEPDRAVRREVRALLEADSQASGFFGHLAGEISPDAASLSPGTRIGPYVLAEKIGEGGMGVVWKAERDDGTFARTVALKILRAGDSRRFLAERQILARLDHPAIARIHDGGLTPDGRPYFAMEYVQGEPITDYAERHGLAVEERLALFAQVCEAVQFAHARLVVHRDLKPSNVLVAEGEGASAKGEKGTPASRAPHPASPHIKLLDFGIAKLLDEDALLTHTGSASPLTPAYAAPEQLLGDEITTATDVYALGVLLYELLTGTRPYGLAGRARRAMEHAILETEPTRPSEAVTQTDTLAEGLRQSRARKLRGDLDHICLAALCKEPEARYGSAEAFAQDVRRHLAGDPVQARGPGALYRVRRFARRHRGAVAGAGLAVLLLLGWAASATLQAQRVADERDRAEALNRVLVELFEGVDPRAGGDRDLTVSEFLATATDQLSRDLDDRPALRAELLSVVASSHLGLGDHVTADSVAGLAATAAEALPPGHPARTTARGSHAWTRTYHGDYQTSERIYRDLLTEASARDRPTVLNDFAIVLGEMGEHDEARTLLRQSIATLRQRDDDESRGSLASALDNLATSYSDDWTAEGYNRAWPLQQEAVQIKAQIHGPDHPQTAEALSELAGLAADRDNLATADSLFARSVSILEAAYGAEHPTLATVINNWALRLDNAGRRERAEPMYRRALAIREAVYGASHQETAGTMQNLAVLVSASPERYEEALALFSRAEAIYLAVLPEGHYLTAFPIAGRASARREAGDDAGALRDGRQSVAILEAALGADHPIVTQVRGQMGVSLARTGRTAEAEPLLRTALQSGVDLSDEDRRIFEETLAAIR